MVYCLNYITRSIFQFNKMSEPWKINTQHNRYVAKNIDTTEDEKWKDNFYFVQAADPQFGFINMISSKKIPYNSSDSTWEEEIKLAETAVEKINKLNPKPRFFIICGDLTNEFPERNKDIQSRQISDFKKVFSNIDPEIPLVCVCGNHDVGDTPTPESIASYRSTYGDDYFSFWCGGIFFIVLNSQYYKDPSKVEELALQQEQWLDKQLKNASGCRIVCFSHIPWFIKAPKEEETIFNISLDTRIRMLDKLYSAGVRHMFCGHYHRNGGGRYKEDFEVIVTSAIGRALGTDVSGLRIVSVSQNSLTHRFYSYVDFPSQVKL